MERSGSSHLRRPELVCMFCGEMADLIDKEEHCILCTWISGRLLTWSPCKIPVEKLLKLGLDEEIVRWAEDCPPGWAHRH